MCSPKAGSESHPSATARNHCGDDMDQRGDTSQLQQYVFPQSENKPAALRGKYGPRTLLEARKVAGSATCKQTTTV